MPGPSRDVDREFMQSEVVEASDDYPQYVQFCDVIGYELQGWHHSQYYPCNAAPN